MKSAILLSSGNVVMPVGLGIRIAQPFFPVQPCDIGFGRPAPVGLSRGGFISESSYPQE